MVVSLASTGPRDTWRGRPCQARPRRFQIQPRPPQQIGRIDLQGNQAADRLQRVAKQVLHPLHAAKQVGQHGKQAAVGIGEQHCRPAGTEQPPLDLGHFQIRIDRLLDVDQMAGGLQVQDAISQATISHHFILFGSLAIFNFFCSLGDLVAGRRTIWAVFRPLCLFLGHGRSICWFVLGLLEAFDARLRRKHPDRRGYRIFA